MNSTLSLLFPLLGKKYLVSMSLLREIFRHLVAILFDQFEGMDENEEKNIKKACRGAKWRDAGVNIFFCSY